MFKARQLPAVIIVGQPDENAYANLHSATSTKTAIEEIGKLHRDVAQQFATTLAVAQALIQTTIGTREGTTLVDEVTIQHLSGEYLQFMLTIVDQAGDEIVRRLAHQRPLSQVGVRTLRQINQLSNEFLQRVQNLYAERG